MPLMIRFAELMYTFEFPLSAGSEEYITSLSVNQLAHDLHMQRVFPYIQKFLNHSAQFNVTHSDLINKWTEELVGLIFRVSFEDRSNVASEVITPEMFHLMILFKDANVDQNRTGSVVYRMGFVFKRKLKLSRMHFWRWSFSYKQLIDIVLESGVFGSNFTIDQARHWYLRSIPYKPQLDFYKDYYYLYDLTNVKVGQDVAKEVKAVYSFRSIGQNCSRTIPAWKCYAKCVTKYFTNTCQCSPLSLDHSHVNTTPCTMDKYDSCRIGQQVARADLHCYEMCPEHCSQDVMSYDRVLLDISEQSDEANDRLKLKFYPAFKKHPVFEETYPLSKMSFWAELGGTFDFWIGASVISVVHLVVYFTKQLIYAFKKNTKTGGNLRHLIGSLTSEEGDHYPGFVSLFTLGMTQQRDYDKEVIRDSTFNIKAAREEIELLNDDVQQQQGKINQSDGMFEEQITYSSGNSQQLEERMVRLEGLLKQQIVQENEFSRDHEDHFQKLETMITEQMNLPRELEQLNETIKQQEDRIQRLESIVAQQNALMGVPYNVKA